MSKWDDFITTLRDGAIKIATGDLKDFTSEIKDSAEEFANDSKADIEKWIKQLADGDITKDDFADQMHGLEALAEMEALKQIALGEIKLQQLRDQLTDLVIDTAIKVLL